MSVTTLPWSPTPESRASRPGVLHRQRLSIDSQDAQHGRVEVVDADRIFHRRIAQIVACPITESGFDSAAREHIGEGLDVVIASIAALRHGRPPELAAEHHQRVVQHAALLQIGDQRRGGPIHFLGLVLNAGFNVGMVIPIAVIKLNEAHAALGQPPGQQAVRSERAIARLGAVRVQNALRFLAHIHQIRNARLHLERHFILRNARENFRIFDGVVAVLVERIDRVNRLALQGGVDARGLSR